MCVQFLCWKIEFVRVNCSTFTVSQDKESFWAQLGNTCSVCERYEQNCCLRGTALLSPNTRCPKHWQLSSGTFVLSRSERTQSAGKSFPAGQQTSFWVSLFQEWHFHYFTWFTKKAFQSSSTSSSVKHYNQDITNGTAAPCWEADTFQRMFPSFWLTRVLTAAVFTLTYALCNYSMERKRRLVGIVWFNFKRENKKSCCFVWELALNRAATDTTSGTKQRSRNQRKHVRSSKTWTLKGAIYILLTGWVYI